MTFEHGELGTAERLWMRDGRFDDLRRLDVLPHRQIVLAAHPDDESLGAAGLAASVAQAGGTVHVIIATDGEASHPRSRTYSPAQLAATRRREVIAAIAAFAPTATVDFLGLPDGQLMDHVPDLERALHTRLTRGTLLVAPWRGDRHPDHAACAHAAERVVRHSDADLLEYPIWAWHWATPSTDQPVRAWEPDGPPRTKLLRFDLDAHARTAKRAALECHLSQTDPLSERSGDEAILPTRMLAHFARPFEIFVAPDAPTTEGAYFDELYAQADDPWELGVRFYEQRKRQVLLASLPKQRYRRAFEPGCATGLLTEALANRCDYVVASDVAQSALDQARTRVRATHAHIEQIKIPEQWPDGVFDLIVISEVGYYCADLALLRTRVENSLVPGGTLIACHWRHPAPDHPHDAETVHSVIGAGLRRVLIHREEDFVVEAWTSTGESVARASRIL